MFLLEEERLRERIKELEEKYTIASSEMEESNERYDKMKAEYEAIEERLKESTLLSRQPKISSMRRICSDNSLKGRSMS